METATIADINKIKVFLIFSSIKMSFFIFDYVLVQLFIKL